ncbi:hypothetical protein BU25DRAFT_31006 [Macroventuria anomochaeta]|uniref:Uncharacterized protein n=1 Tax=Macroventuria anomochaeta TaxID=301207 RepID=A0ACB6S3I4_9PLEO|nr:uncharacterized protein BU25DRAFT_31006 [Macroventuria anomochaeta]KAF2628721.1 hypothetical protein BU25DRAFT_31006 [Macroventuria anomochaeta]
MLHTFSSCLVACKLSSCTLTKACSTDPKSSDCASIRSPALQATHMKLHTPPLASQVYRALYDCLDLPVTREQGVDRPQFPPEQYWLGWQTEIGVQFEPHSRLESRRVVPQTPSLHTLICYSFDPELGAARW